jgi:hypothetical protein
LREQQNSSRAIDVVDPRKDARWVTEIAGRTSADVIATDAPAAPNEPAAPATPGVKALAIGVSVLAVLSLWAVSVPGSYFGLVLLLVYPWLGAAAVWVIQVIRVGRWKGSAGIRSLRWLLATGVVVVVTALACWLQAPLYLRFALSLSQMNAVAAQLSAADPDAVLTDQWIGLFDAERIERINGGMRFLVKGTGFLDPGGFAYSPSGEPEIIGEDWYQPFVGPWWLWEESW